MLAGCNIQRWPGNTVLAGCNIERWPGNTVLPAIYRGGLVIQC